MNKNKKGAFVGFLPVSFFATLFIIVLLIIFILGSALIKEFGEAGDFELSRESKLGIGNSVSEYMDYDYKKILESRAIKQKAIKESGGGENGD